MVKVEIILFYYFMLSNEGKEHQNFILSDGFKSLT